MPRQPGIVGTLEELVRLVDGSAPGPTMPREARDRARRRALELLDALGPAESSEMLAVLAFAAEMFWSTAVDLAAHPPDARRLIERVVELTGAPRLALGREVLRAPQLPPLPVEIAIEAQLALLVAFTDLPAVSLWTLWHGGELRHIAAAGSFEPEDPTIRDAARTVLAGRGLAPESVIGVRIDRLGQPPAALVAGRSPDSTVAEPGLLLELAAPGLGLLLEREELLARDQPRDETMMTSVERRLARLRYDLHDGPQQDVHLLATDLELFRHQLHSIIADHAHAGRLFGRLDDLAAQLVALDGDLRRLSSSMQSPFLQPGSLPDALREVTDAFAARTHVEPQTTLEGDLTKLTDSQQITLLALIREALSNIRQHSEARRVTITISSQEGRVSAEVTDDGRGFDPETALVQAARDGHIGLVGMHERVRMLGGQTTIESRPGGPTVISVSLPPWPAIN